MVNTNNAYIYGIMSSGDPDMPPLSDEKYGTEIRMHGVASSTPVDPLSVSTKQDKALVNPCLPPSYM